MTAVTRILSAIEHGDTCAALSERVVRAALTNPSSVKDLRRRMQLVGLGPAMNGSAQNR
jgi:hypothetical protein